MSALVAYQWTMIVFLGAVLGSFVHALVLRVRAGQSIAHGRSRCDACQHTLHWYENIPIASYLWLRGQCRSCKKKIPQHYLWHEVGLAAAFALVGAVWFWRGGTLTDPQLWYLLFLATVLSFIFWYDALFTEILDGSTTYLALPAAVASVFLLGHSLYSVILGALVGAGWFYAQYVLSRGRWVGGGDVRMGLFMGACLGLLQVGVALLFSYVLGAAVSLGQVAAKKTSFGAETPFGTYLALGTLFALLFSEPIVNFYRAAFIW